MSLDVNFHLSHEIAQSQMPGRAGAGFFVSSGGLGPCLFFWWSRTLLPSASSYTPSLSPLCFWATVIDSSGKPGCCMLLSYSIFFVPHARTSIKNRNPFSSWFEGLDFWESGTCTCLPDVSQQRAFHGGQRKCASLNLSSLSSIMEALSCDLISS